MGGITACRAETQVIGSLVPLNRRREMLKFIGWGEEISSRMYYAASTVPRAGKVGLLLWRTVKQSTAPLEARRRRNTRDYRGRATPNPNNKPAKAFLALRSHTYATTPCFEARWGALSTAAADPFPLSNLPADAHPRPRASIERS